MKSCRRTIVGVAPPRFEGLSIDRSADLWISSITPAPQQMIAGLAPGITPAQAREAVDLLIRQVAQQQPKLLPWDDRLKTEIVPAGKGLSTLRVQYERSLLALGVLVTIVLLITCTNVGSLLVVRNAAP